MKLTDEQKVIIGAPLNSISVIACAGSGKTKTAVNRLYKVRADLVDDRGYIALLSFSNTAVNAFKGEFRDKQQCLKGKLQDRVVIETLDSFITTNILRPHAYRVMECSTTPFLLTGNENFLKNDKCKFWVESPNQNFPVPANLIGNVSIEMKGDDPKFYFQNKGSRSLINNGVAATEAIGKIGGYTHELGKIWAYQTLIQQPGVLKSLSKRYPHIIVDEAQDLDSLHWSILKLLSDAGSTITLIGDPNQAIYEFAGANGEVIKQFDADNNNNGLPLTKNYRSIEDILTIANKLSQRNDDHEKDKVHPQHGAYYIPYDPKKMPDLAVSFTKHLEAIGLKSKESAILFRGNAGIEKLKSSKGKVGVGKSKIFAMAAIKRDVNQDYHKSFQLCLGAIVGLLESPPDDFAARILQPGLLPEDRALRQLLWAFVRDPDKGLPHVGLKGKIEWQPLLKQRIISLLAEIENNFGIKPTARLGNNITIKEMDDAPIAGLQQLQINPTNNIRVDTVHQSKGESLDAVLYVATAKDHIRNMLDGTDTEVGRIGYVALTRARYLFVLAVPKANIKEFKPELKQLGLREWNAQSFNNVEAKKINAVVLEVWELLQEHKNLVSYQVIAKLYPALRILGVVRAHEVSSSLIGKNINEIGIILSKHIDGAR